MIHLRKGINPYILYNIDIFTYTYICFGIIEGCYMSEVRENSFGISSNRLEEWSLKINCNDYDSFFGMLKSALHYDIHTKNAINPVTRNSFLLSEESLKGDYIYYLARKWNAAYGLSEEEWDFLSTVPASLDMNVVYTEEELKEQQSRDDKDIQSYRKKREEDSQAQNDYLNRLGKGYKKGIIFGKKQRETMLDDVMLNKYRICAFVNAKKKAVLKKSMGLSKKKKEDICVSAKDIVSVIASSSDRKFFEMFSEEEILAKIEDFLSMDQKEIDAIIHVNSSVLQEFLDKGKGNFKRSFQNFLYTLTYISLFFMIYRYFIASINLDLKIVSNNILYLLVFSVMPFLTWVWLTDGKSFSFNHTLKYRFLFVAVIHAILIFMQPLYYLYAKLASNIFIRIPVGEHVTPAIARFVAVSILLALTAATFALIAKNIFPILKSDEIKEKLIAFKFGQKFDIRKGKEYEYNLNVFTNVDNGKKIVIPEDDLYTHVTLVGASGTGKTSITIIPQIIENIRTRLVNIDWQQQRVLEMVRAKKVRIIEPFKRDMFNRQYFEVTEEKWKKEFEAIFEKRQSCGITVIAPNADVGNKIIQYCNNRGVKVNNIDPTKKKATYTYERLCGMNALALPSYFFDIKPGDDAAEEERTIRIAETANNLADALTAINELNGGGGDQYFTDVNTTVTSAISQVLMLYASIKRKQTNLAEVSMFIEQFAKLPSVVKEIEDFFDIQGLDDIVESGRKSINKELRNARKENETDFEKEQEMQDRAEEEMFNTLRGKERENPYIRTLITVKNRLVKGGQMDEHAEGLRNLMRKVLQDPQVERVLVKNEDIIDFDEILANGEITVINTALEVGKNSSTCFGQLFILNFNSAVLRRKQDTRIPHFLYIDETARYLSDTLDTMCTLYRQYMVSCMFCLQNLQQLDRVRSLSYLKSVLLSCGSLIVFGRTSWEDSDLFSKLSGQTRYDMPQKTEARGSWFSDEPHTNTSVRYTPDIKQIAEAHDIRYRDFQDCTILASEHGRPMPARFARGDFAPRELFTIPVEHTIERNNTWNMVWQYHYPKVVGIMPVTRVTVVSSKQPVLFNAGTTMTSEPEESFKRYGTEEQLPRGVSVHDREFTFDDDDELDEEDYSVDSGRIFSYMAAGATQDNMSEGKTVSNIAMEGAPPETENVDENEPVSGEPQEDKYGSMEAYLRAYQK